MRFPNYFSRLEQSIYSYDEGHGLTPDWGEVVRDAAGLTFGVDHPEIKRAKYFLSPCQINDLLRQALVACVGTRTCRRAACLQRCVECFVGAGQKIERYVMILAMLCGGLTAGEVTRLRAPKITFQTRVLKLGVRKSPGGRGIVVATGGTIALPQQTVTMSAELAGALWFLLCEEGAPRESGLVFNSQRGGTYNAASVTHVVDEFALQAPTIRRAIGAAALRRTWALNAAFSGGLALNGLTQLLQQRSAGRALAYLFEL